jgi:hypothetical protein
VGRATGEVNLRYRNGDCTKAKKMLHVTCKAGDRTLAGSHRQMITCMKGNVDAAVSRGGNTTEVSVLFAEKQREINFVAAS